MLEEMLLTEAASAIEHCALPNRRLRIQISDIHSCGDAKKFFYCKLDEEQNRKSRPDEDGIENGTMVGIECGIKIRTKSVFGIGIKNGAETDRDVMYAAVAIRAMSLDWHVRHYPGVKNRTHVDGQSPGLPKYILLIQKSIG
ncbi:hypothetical protein EVAR_8788_1 [Eumeta japonica]|uniref:Uncharacterized protein n=1 Tax=Eumeta variegata TaxID=151549 RepID=A0A4C1TTT9_EUMVA|nr:hypothetical protein EVAR_8788_1 [Eumeta japonica]